MPKVLVAEILGFLRKQEWLGNLTTPPNMNAMNKERFICINNEGYPVSLEMFATYEAIPDDEAAKRDLIRIIDESGEDYLYPKSRFALATLPQKYRLRLSARI